jgi:hypothetical protein
LARLSFAYFSLAKQRKVRPAAGASPAASKKCQLQAKDRGLLARLFFDQAKKSKACGRHLAANRQKPSFTAHKW